MSLKQRLQSDQIQAMRAKDRVRLSVLRMLRSALGYEEIEKKRELDDGAVVDIISRQARQRQESIRLFGDAGRQDLVDKETAELEILRGYLPEQVGEEELTALAKAVVTEVGAASLRDKGNVMRLLMPQVRGKAEGADVNRVVTALLSGDAP